MCLAILHYLVLLCSYTCGLCWYWGIQTQGPSAPVQGSQRETTPCSIILMQLSHCLKVRDHPLLVCVSCMKRTDTLSLFRHPTGCDVTHWTLRKLITLWSTLMLLLWHTSDVCKDIFGIYVIRARGSGKWPIYTPLIHFALFFLRGCTDCNICWTLHNICLFALYSIICDTHLVRITI